jgi:hypothetical protein
VAGGDADPSPPSSAEVKNRAIRLLSLRAFVAYERVKSTYERDYAVAQLVEALRYKLECSGVRFPMVSLEFFIYIILPAALWP